MLAPIVLSDGDSANGFAELDGCRCACVRAHVHRYVHMPACLSVSAQLCSRKTGLLL